MLGISFIVFARRLFQRHRELKDLRRLEELYLSRLHQHSRQNELEGPSAHRVHHVESRFNLARLQRVRDQERMLQTGKDFWQLHNIDRWAARLSDLEREKSPEFAYMCERIPDAALFQVIERMRQLRAEQTRPEREAFLARLASLTRQEVIEQRVELMHEVRFITGRQSPSPSLAPSL